jgi:hypothetical protein
MSFTVCYAAAQCIGCDRQREYEEIKRAWIVAAHSSSGDASASAGRHASSSALQLRSGTVCRPQERGLVLTALRFGQRGELYG